MTGGQDNPAFKKNFKFLVKKVVCKWPRRPSSRNDITAFENWYGSSCNTSHVTEASNPILHSTPPLH